MFCLHFYSFIAVGCMALLFLSFVKFLLKPKLPVDFHVTFLVLFWFLFPLFGMYLISFRVPMYINRYLIYALPAYYITICLCVIRLFEKEKIQTLIFISLITCFAFTLEYNPDKKQPITEIISVIKENKTPETSVIVYPYELFPVFSYNYNREAFSKVYDQKQFNLTDSLLRAEGIYHVSDIYDYEKFKGQLKNEILYFAGGKHRNNSEDPVYRQLLASYSVAWEKKAGDNWYISRLLKK